MIIYKTKKIVLTFLSKRSTIVVNLMPMILIRNECNLVAVARTPFKVYISSRRKTLMMNLEAHMRTVPSIKASQ